MCGRAKGHTQSNMPGWGESAGGGRERERGGILVKSQRVRKRACLTENWGKKVKKLKHSHTWKFTLPKNSAKYKVGGKSPKGRMRDSAKKGSGEQRQISKNSLRSSSRLPAFLTSLLFLFRAWQLPRLFLCSLLSIPGFLYVWKWKCLMETEKIQSWAEICVFLKQKKIHWIELVYTLSCPLIGFQRSSSHEETSHTLLNYWTFLFEIKILLVCCFVLFRLQHIAAEH